MNPVNTARVSNNYDQPRRLMDHLTTAVVLLDEQMKVQYVNPAAEQLMAASQSQLAGMSINALINDKDQSTQADLENALRDLHPFTKREAQVYILNNPQLATVDYTITPIRESTNNHSLLLELRPLDRLMRISREDNLINAHHATRALVRGVAHEVKNPLGGIRGAAQLLARELPDDSLREYTDIIIAEVDRLRNLVDQMLGPRKLPKWAQVNIHEILERVRSVLTAETGDPVSIERDYDPSLPEMCGDKDQLIQAILNVVRNAKQALTEFEEQESPTIILRTRALRQFTIGHTRHRLILLVEIEDNGPGISKEMQETMFYPMISGRASGTGLGLSISQSIINQHHGLVECESNPGKTIFRLLLPLEQPEEHTNVGA
ncbi:nitrogen regulation protein NR(II) [Ketobacter sp.]|uniref:nitrogen regulation protein NR(II) n=1 Tax=Ketobacter sp. TaxID=2083498 RepID=UPI000F1E7669|nr:nitrogen regulation protein NR(II) [Ketobacter sp.]MEE2733235.1 nitrogen regulation protein NR(II) [Pseudomonadota bacterium]RLU01858.1 MAG: nitrogen regulation protein NR(II) [Ketobacter sp.]